MAAKTPKHFGVFTRKNPDGKTVERAAYTPADAVAMEFNGWERKADATATPADAERVAAEGPRVLGGLPGDAAGDSSSTKSETRSSK